MCDLRGACAFMRVCAFVNSIWGMGDGPEGSFLILGHARESLAEDASEEKHGCRIPFLRLKEQLPDVGPLCRAAGLCICPCSDPTLPTFSRVLHGVSCFFILVRLVQGVLSPAQPRNFRPSATAGSQEAGTVIAVSPSHSDGGACVSSEPHPRATGGGWAAAAAGQPRIREEKDKGTTHQHTAQRHLQRPPPLKASLNQIMIPCTACAHAPRTIHRPPDSIRADPPPSEDQPVATGSGGGGGVLARRIFWWAFEGSI
jgi:hypothetical protein